MGRPRLTTGAGVALVALFVAVAVAATALAGITVYKNTFARKSDAKELRHAEGKHCRRSLRKKAGNLRVDVTKSPETCGYRPPVEGDTDGPNHSFEAKVRFLRNKSSGLRKHAYVAVAVRSGKSSGYELRVFPVDHRFRSSASPRAAGTTSPPTARARRSRASTRRTP